MPFPKEEVTPPVTNIYLAVDMEPRPKILVAKVAYLILLQTPVFQFISFLTNLWICLTLRIVILKGYNLFFTRIQILIKVYL